VVFKPLRVLGDGRDALGGDWILDLHHCFISATAADGIAINLDEGDELKWIRMTSLTPLWAAVPDVVANRKGTLDNWKRYAAEILTLGWPAAFCVQDGMTPGDVPADADVVFVGGSDRWKFPNLKMWTSNFPRVHCARVNAPQMIESCEQLGCESVDGTGWFRDPSRPDKVPMLERFIEGHRNGTPELPMAFALHYNSSSTEKIL
jgi:hypothetical protein